MLAMQPRHQLKNHLRCAPVKIASGLIGQQNLGLGYQCPRQCKSLLLAARKFARTMRAARFQPHFAQPTRSFLLGGSNWLATRQQGHSHIFQRGELRQQVVKLPDIADFAVTELGGIIFGKRIHLGIRAVYGTGRWPIKSAQDVQQGTLSRTRLPDNSEHRSLINLKRQIFKEHQVRFA